MNRSYESEPQNQAQLSMEGVISKEEFSFLRELNLFYFCLLEIQMKWDNFQKYIRNKDANGKHYYEQEQNGFSFSSGERKYYFFKSTQQKPQDYSVDQYPNSFYDDRKYAVAALTFEYILFYKQFIDVLDKKNQQQVEMKIQKPNSKSSQPPQNESIAYLCKSNLQRDIFIQSKNANNGQINNIFPLSPLTKANYFMKALGSARVFKTVKEIENWQRWKVYWYTKNHPIFCYSTCSGNCRDYCKDAPCIFIYPLSELENEALPDVEKIEPSNIFSDELYFLAYQLHAYSYRISEY